MHFRGFNEVSVPPSGYSVIQLQNRMDSLGYQRSAPGVWGDPERQFLELYAQQIGLDTSTVSGDDAVAAVLPVIDTDIGIAQSGALHTAPVGGGPITADPTQITGGAQDNGGLMWGLGAVLAAKLLGFF